MRVLLVSVGAVLMLIAGPASAGIEGPCDGSVSIGGRTYGPGNDTAADPIVVADVSGLVAQWQGSTTGPITDHSGEIGVVVGPGTVRIASWGGANEELETAASGTYAVDEAREALPVDVVGLYELRGSHTGEGGSCKGSVMVRVEGDPLTTPIGAGSTAVAVLAGVGVGLAGVPRPR